MTKRERAAVASTLREWAAWCEANPGAGWWRAWGALGYKYVQRHVAHVAAPWCDYQEDWHLGYHTGPTAATGLCLAAAMIEAGDDV